MTLEIHGQPVTLLPQHALYLENVDILCLADVHIVPEDLGRILNLVRETQPESLYIIGDFIHDIKGLTPELSEQVKAWRKELNCAVVLLEEAHDRKTQPYLIEWNIVLAQSMTVENFVFAPQLTKPDKPGQVVVSGHVHPTITLQTDQGQQRLPCFIWEEPHLILPSFGSFARGADIRRHHGARYFSVADGMVVEV